MKGISAHATKTQQHSLHEHFGRPPKRPVNIQTPFPTCRTKFNYYVFRLTLGVGVHSLPNPLLPLPCPFPPNPPLTSLGPGVRPPTFSNSLCAAGVKLPTFFLPGVIPGFAAAPALGVGADKNRGVFPARTASGVFTFDSLSFPDFLIFIRSTIFICSFSLRSLSLMVKGLGSDLPAPYFSRRSVGASSSSEEGPVASTKA